MKQHATLVVAASLSVAAGACGGSAPSLTATELASGWSKIGADEQVGAFAVSPDLGMVMVGFREQGPGGGLDVWYSDDGRDWTHLDVFDDHPDLYVTDVAAGGSGFVAVANDISVDRSEVWTSSDGLAWNSIADTDLPSGPCATLSEVVATDLGFVAVGCDGGGSELVLSSSDGVEWVPYAPPRGAAVLHAVAGKSGFIVLGVPDTVLWSDDGADWTVVDVETAPTADAVWYWDETTAVGPDGLLLQTGTTVGQPMVWTSDDHGSHWREHEVSLPVGLEGRPMLFFELAYTPFGYVGVGLLDAADEETFEAVADGAIGFVIHSTDGDDWTAAELVETPPFTELTWSDEALYGTFAGYGTWVWTPPES